MCGRPSVLRQAAALQEACAAAAAIHSALELGVIARISEAPADPAAVATDCGLTPQGAAALLSALAGLDLLKLGDDGRFRPACSGLDQLVELFRPWACSLTGTAWPAAAGERGDNRRRGVPLSESRLPARNSLPPKRRAGSRAARAAGTPRPRHRRRRSSVEPRHCAREPSSTVTAVELHAVMRSTHTAVRKAGIEDRYEFVEGSAFEVDWGEPATYDLALIANICHLFDENTNLQLLRRVADALRPAGRVAIVDVLPTERGDGPRPAVLYALGLVLRTSSGRIYPYSTFRRWLGQEGFEDPRRRELPGPFPFTLITAIRR